MKRKVLTTMVPTIPPKAKDSDKDVKPYYYDISSNAIHIHSVTTVYKYTVIALLCVFLVLYSSFVTCACPLSAHPMIAFQKAASILPDTNL